MILRNILKHTQKSFQNQKLFYYPVHQAFSSLAAIQKDLNFKNPFKIIMSRKNEDLFEIEVLFANQQQEQVTVLQTDSEGNIGDLLEGIREQYKIKGDLRAYTLDKKELSETVMLDDLEGSNFYICDLTNKHLFLVHNQDVEIKNEYQKIDKYCKDINLSYIQKQTIINYLNRVDTIVRMKTGQEIFSDESQQPDKRLLINKSDLVKSMIEALPTNKNQHTEYEASLMLRYQELQKVLSQMSQQKAFIDNIAHKQVKRKMSLGLFALVGQFCFVGFGTYHVWSWDIVEPMAYFLTSAGVIYLNTHFFKYFQDYSNEGFYDYLKDKQLEKLYLKYEFNLDQYNLIQQEINSLERKLKSLLLSNF
ncbi:transmembrane protein, putative (macronuclear) [Tetrahymena thermophila SB210]|uniref:Transmembrane protein, putative n=1 Tax=Tetrahymena thermophila (strain SB210) TaxID=312017 RepID=I7M0N6_TETTS|nr:transmembrane protein, putative [Tetrahymena thermophila SB210]EAR89938.1 transmembrane protein, putative [Tetrahymena thermophila SB210]|eukprot:XP_001010183.1 transmembrane protein, putative [Tetrahymena thermophila SB210]